jgi:hypothetical protein
MNDKGTKFPQYRRLTNGKHFYKIIDNKKFEEIQLVGTKVKYYVVEATQYPEMLRIMDMLNSISPFDFSSEEEWSELRITNN